METPELGDHFGEIFVADTADFFQGGDVAPGDEIEPANQGRHCRIIAIALLELDGQAFGEIARANAGWLERLQKGDPRLDLGKPGPKPFRSSREIAGDVAGF